MGFNITYPVGAFFVFVLLYGVHQLLFDSFRQMSCALELNGVNDHPWAVQRRLHLGHGGYSNSEDEEY
jgi:hypothetical protein